MVIRLLLLSLP